MSTTLMEEIRFTEVTDENESQFTEEDKQYIIAKIYEHFGRPNNIVKQTLCLYKGWNAGGVQRARLTTYYSQNSTDMFADNYYSQLVYKNWPQTNLCIPQRINRK